jgi:DNA-directed RNA polymerase subunit RPC12/RpoP
MLSEVNMIWKILLIVFLVPVLFTAIVLVRWYRSPSKKTSYACSFCGEEVTMDSNYCPQCGSEFLGVKLTHNKIDKQAG